MNNITEIPKRVRVLRERQGLSQKDLARLLGTRQSAISRLESGTGNVTLSFLSRVARVLGYDLSVDFWYRGGD